MPEAGRSSCGGPQCPKPSINPQRTTSAMTDWQKAMTAELGQPWCCVIGSSALFHRPWNASESTHQRQCGPAVSSFRVLVGGTRMRFFDSDLPVFPPGRFLGGARLTPPFGCIGTLVPSRQPTHDQRHQVSPDLVPFFLSSFRVFAAASPAFRASARLTHSPLGH